jgi:hypothetical protein
MSSRSQFSEFFDTNKRPFVSRGQACLDYCGYCNSGYDARGKCNCDGFGGDPADQAKCRCGGVFIPLHDKGNVRHICNSCRQLI